MFRYTTTDFLIEDDLHAVKAGTLVELISSKLNDECKSGIEAKVKFPNGSIAGICASLLTIKQEE